MSDIEYRFIEGTPRRAVLADAANIQPGALNTIIVQAFVEFD
jgi:hypothetical protein